MVLRCLGVARSASSPKEAQALGCSLTPGLRISFGRVTCMARAASVPGLWTLGSLLLRGTCVRFWVVLGLRPPTPGWGVRVCVRLCAQSACTPPLLAGVCGVGVCSRVRFSAAPRHCWLGCRGFCLLVCAHRLNPATPGWAMRCGCVCFGSGFGCAPPLLAGVLGFVCACVRAPPVPRYSWLGGAAWVCVLGVGFGLRPASPGLGFRVCVFLYELRLYPATPGWGVRRGCVCLGSGLGCAPALLAGVFGCACAHSACTPPLLDGSCDVGVRASARVPAAPRHSWLGCWGVCVLVCVLRLYLATPGWGVRCGCLCLGSGFCCAPPLLAGVLQ